MLSLDVQLPPKQLSIQATGSFYLFQKNYILAKKHKDEKAFNYCLDSLSYCFDYLEYLFHSDYYSNNLLLLTLVKVLRADNKPSAPIEWKLHTYKEYLRFHDLSFKDELVFAFIQHMNKEHKLPELYRTEAPLLYLITRELKSFLFKRIRKVLYTHVRNGAYLIPIENEYYYFDSFLDKTMFDNTKVLSHYLYLLSTNKNTPIEETSQCLFQNLMQLNN